MDGLYDDAELYDLVAPPSAEMEEFYLGAGGPGRSVLELACGSGRFTIPLAASGAAVTGGDISLSMLDRAWVVAAERGVAPDLVQLDMRGFSLGRTFDAIIIAANSLMHLHTIEDFRAAFSAIRAHLAPGGQLMFDIYVPNAALLCLPPDTRQPVAAFHHPAYGDVTVEETIEYDPASQISRADWFWSTATRNDFRHTRLQLRQIYPQELPLLLDLGGLELRERFGDFRGGPFTPQSWRQVCIATAA